LADARGRHASIVGACVDFLAELLGPRRFELLATVELRVVAARRPDVLSLGSPWPDGVIPIMRAFGADEDRARATFAAFYGFAVLSALQAEPPTADEIRRFVTTTLLGSEHRSD
jgi:hypothetical protein